MSISSVGQGPVTPATTNNTVQQKPTTQATNSASNSSSTTNTTGAQPLNTSGRGQIVNLVV